MRRRPLGEADEIVTCLSPDEGKLDAVAKGSRRSQSRLVGLLEPFTYLHAQLARGKTLDPITQARPVKTFPALRADLERLAYGSYLLELWSSCLPFREPAPRAFSLLVQGLDALDRGWSPALLCRWLELHLLDDLGYGPDFSECLSCGSPVKQGWFSPVAGQIACRDCGPSAPGALPVSPKAVSAIHHLRRMALSELQGRTPTSELAAELQSLLRVHLAYHWPHSLRSLKVLDSLAG